jgi:hypothetical protein
VYYIASNNHVQQLFYSVSLNRWFNQDLTAFTGGPSAASNAALSSFAISDGQHVFYLASDQHVHQLYYSPTTNAWIDQDLTAFTGGSSVAQGTGISSFDITDGQHIYYIASNLHVKQLYYSPTLNRWFDQDLTAFSNGPLASSSTALSSFATADGQHVFFIGNNQHVEQLYYSPSSNAWSAQDLTAFTGGTVAAWGTGISGFAIADGQHVYYVDANRHFAQLFYSPSLNRWLNQDLTGLANGPLAWSGTGVSSFAISDGQHVYYIADPSAN